MNNILLGSHQFVIIYPLLWRMHFLKNLRYSMLITAYKKLYISEVWCGIILLYLTEVTLTFDSNK